ncbi:helix-turn-helix domain-containing protein [Streptomyces uncialis]|uniref:helix-turn-helix domain-containing protein n=1 Tax=Streptomyces uncialis TaxID=1048205 RepID=UPI00224ED54E|nr:helix-turn-helix transcriptional regulator [Streptomyces uncialis]MCX4659142.1 helix-turn-helix domain-containing protein [Streptomyces uncialis]
MSAEQHRQPPAIARVLALQQERDDAPAILLGMHLRRLREDRGLTLADAGPLIRASQSKISRMERAESTVREPDVWDLVKAYGAPPSERTEINELLRQVRKERGKPSHSDITPGFLRRLVTMEQSSTEVFAYESNAVPGLLQTPEYARAMVAGVLADEHGVVQDEFMVERYVFARGDRWADFRETGGKVVAILDELALLRPVGDVRVMAEQMRYLLAAGGSDKVSIRVIPLDRGYAMGSTAPFTRLLLPAHPRAKKVVYVEQPASAHYHLGEARLDEYQAQIDRAMRLALYWKDSKVVLEKAAERYEATAASHGF